MADTDADLFFQKVIAILKSDVDIISITAKSPNGSAFVTPSKFIPLGNKYPQITVNLDSNKSEEQFPAGRYNLIIKYWTKDDDQQYYAKLVAFRNVIDNIVNRHPETFTDINVSANTGVRCVQLLRRFCEFDYDREHNKYFADYRIDLVLSEEENFGSDSAGDKPWV